MFNPNRYRENPPVLAPLSLLLAPKNLRAPPRILRAPLRLKTGTGNTANKKARTRLPGPTDGIPYITCGSSHGHHPHGIALRQRVRRAVHLLKELDAQGTGKGRRQVNRARARGLQGQHAAQGGCGQPVQRGVKRGVAVGGAVVHKVGKRTDGQPQPVVGGPAGGRHVHGGGGVGHGHAHLVARRGNRYRKRRVEHGTQRLQPVKFQALQQLGVGAYGNAALAPGPGALQAHFFEQLGQPRRQVAVAHAAYRLGKRRPEGLARKGRPAELAVVFPRAHKGRVVVDFVFAGAVGHPGQILPAGLIEGDTPSLIKLFCLLITIIVN